MTKWRDEKKQFANLYIADKSIYGGFFNIRQMSGKVSSQVHEGNATFNEAGNEMFFTRSNLNGKNEKNVINLKIYNAELIDGKWSNIQELPLNDEDYSNCHPSLNSDGTALYFASNRPGGFGGMDLYVSRNINGIWQKPINLGPQINSKHNEVFPFISQTGTIYFSSNNESSNGGLDIFKAIPNSNTNERFKIEHLGKDFNSTEDDFGFCMKSDDMEGYFSSNRKGGKGGDDIYFWQKQLIELPPNQLDITITDTHSDEYISTATVTIFDGAVISSKEDIYPIANMMRLSPQNPYSKLDKKVFQTGIKGKISLITKPTKSYTVFVEKEGYIPLKKVIREKDVEKINGWRLKLKRKAGIPLVVQAFEMPAQEEVPFVKLALTNQCTKETQMAISDQNGQYTFYLACGCDYKLVGQKDGYRAYQKEFFTKNRNCGNLNTIQTDLYMIEKEVLAEIAKRETQRFYSFEAFEQQTVKKVGQIILFDKVLFPENKTTILPLAEEELYEIHYFLQEHPELQIEISIHTDERGTAKFNHRLSQKRADTIAAFLLRNGIPKEQFTAIGYGEDKLLYQCPPDIQCDESELFQNKRIELKVTRIQNYKENYLLGQR